MGDRAGRNEGKQSCFLPIFMLTRNLFVAGSNRIVGRGTTIFREYQNGLAQAYQNAGVCLAYGTVCNFLTLAIAGQK